MPEQDPFAYLQEEDADPFSYLSQPATAPDPFAYLAQSVGSSESSISAVPPVSSALGGIPSLFAQAAESGLKSFPAFASMMAGGAGQTALGAGKLGLGMAPGFVQRVGNVALAPLEAAAGIASQYGRETLEEESRRQYNLTQAAKAAGLGPVGTGILRGVAYAPDALLQVGTGALGMLGRGLIRAGTKPFARAAMAEGVAKNTVGDIAREIAERRPAGAVLDLEPVGPATRETPRAGGGALSVESKGEGVVRSIAGLTGTKAPSGAPATTKAAFREGDWAVLGSMPLTDAELELAAASQEGLYRMRQAGGAQPLVPTAIVDNMVAKSDAAGRTVSSWLSPERATEVLPWQREALKSRAADRIIEQAAAGRQVRRAVDPVSGLEGKRQASLLTRGARDWAVRPEVLAEDAGPEVRDILFESLGVQAHRQQLGMARAHHDYWVSALEDASGLSVQSHGFDRWLRGQVELPTLSHDTLKITRDEAAHLLAMVKDPDNRAAILRSGLWSERLDTSKPIRVAEGAIRSLEQSLGVSGEGRMAQAAVDRMPAVAGEINKATGRVAGQEIATRPRYFHRSRHELDKEAPLSTFKEFREQVLDSMGFLKERTGGDAPIVLRGLSDDFVNHVDSATRFAANLEPVTTATEMLGRADVKEALAGRLGESGYRRLMESIDAQSMSVRDRHGLTAAVRAATRPVGAGILGLRPGPVLKAPAGLAVSMAYEDNAIVHLAHGLKALARPREVDELARRFSPVWNDRYYGHGFMHQVTSGMGGTTRRRFGPKTIAERSLQPLETADKGVNIIRWGMAEKDVAEKMPHLVRGSEEWGRRVAMQWERQLYRGDNTAHGMEMSGILAYGKRNPLAGQYLMFQSAQSKAYSLAPRAVSQLRRGDVRGAIKSAAGLVASAAYTGAVGTSLYAAHRVKGSKEMKAAADPRSGEARKNYLKGLVKEFAGLPPLLGNLGLQALARHVMGEGFFQYPAGGVEGVVMDGVRGVADLAGAMRDQFEREYDKDGPAFVKKLNRAMLAMIESAATFRGLPAGGLIYDLETGGKLFGDFRPDADPPDPADSVLRRGGGSASGSGVTKAGNKLRVAVESGDSALFREALLDRKRALGKMKQSYILSSVLGQTRYRGLGKYEPKIVAGMETNKDRLALSGDELDAIDARIAEREQMREMVLSLLHENSDLVTGFVGDEQDYLESLKASGQVRFTSPYRGTAGP